jgi:hypothetical protein
MEAPMTVGPLGLWPLPVWFWPLLVCLAAWLFRRWMLRGEISLAGRPARSGRGWMVSARKATSPGTAEPSRRGAWMPDGLLRRLTESLAGLWQFTGGRGAVNDGIAVLGRRMVGPQQQVLILRAGDHEHTVLLQGGGPALLLSSRPVKVDGPREQRPFRRVRGRAALGGQPKRARGRREIR